jgi:hypothetical protein
MKCYTDSFRENGDNFPYPGKAHTFDSLGAVMSAYEEFAITCDNFGCEPAPLWVYIGEPDGDEEKYGYPDGCDYIIRIGPRGGIIKERCY